MSLITFLICYPFLMALLISLVRNSKVRGILVYIGSGAIIAATLSMLTIWITEGCPEWKFLTQTHTINMGMLVFEALMVVLVVYMSFKYKKYWVCLLSIVQTAMIFWLELAGPELAENNHIFVDRLSMLMVVIIGVVGGLICVYAVGYMHGYHQHHKDVKDRRYFFLPLLFVFLGAMFGLVLSEDLIWIDFFWEITSLCSFLLIGYTRTTEAINNSFRALWMNLLGGLGFAIAILVAAVQMGNTSLHVVVDNKLVIPVALLAFAGLTKSAQFPFSRWLLGAMVAPTPSSTLLHSATMVKAGIYMLLRLAPAMAGTMTGQMVAIIGGFTFISASMLAISQSDGKKVLAYSTVSNLGLMAACAGVGKMETVWAGVFLMIFHAVSKSMLFQTVGAIENTTGSRDIEDMNYLMLRLPRLAFCMITGIAGMFLAPFGMLISKWAALKAFVDAKNVILVVFLVYGSATTMYYWTKWLIKLLSRAKDIGPIKDKTKKNEMVSIYTHCVMMILLCISFPWLSRALVEPLLYEMYGKASSVLSTGNLYIMIIMLCSIFVFPLLMFLWTKNLNRKNIISYMNGINTGTGINFTDSFGKDKELVLSNWYMTELFGENKLLNPSIMISAIVLVVMLCWIIGGAF